MKITTEILKSAGTCDESLKHFIQILGNGDENFTMDYKDAMRYLIQLKKQDSEKYGNWPGFLLKVKENLKEK